MSKTFLKVYYFKCLLHTFLVRGNFPNIIFLDPDILFLKSIPAVFSKKFDVGITIMCGEIGNMNPGVLFCRQNATNACFNFHLSVVEQFSQTLYTHTGDQRSIGLLLQQVPNFNKLLWKAMEEPITVYSKFNNFTFLFLPGSIYNACPGKLFSESAVAVHYKGPRKTLLLQHYKNYFLPHHTSALARRLKKRTTYTC